MMNLERDLVFCYIEEDNIQRAYFRVRPLLTVHGDVQEEAASLWPDDGCLRIVPDRNEQHTFKERMRTLGDYCMMNLQGIPADANKIRTNKNYKPDRGETNQYILYSDTVHALPEHTFFEVLAGQAGQYAQLARAAVTPLFYIRQDDTLYGPVSRKDPSMPKPAAEAEGVLYPLSCPDGKERVMLCIPQPAAVPAPAPSPVSEPAPMPEPELPIGKPLKILDQSKNFEETIQSLDQPLSSGANLLRQNEPAPTRDTLPPHPDKPLTGTPLFRASMRTSVPQPKNKLQEVVAAQWRVARNEPPTAPLPAGARMRQVENPVEQACESMRAAWQVPEAHTQLIDFLLSLDGMRAKLERSVNETVAGSPLNKALQDRLQDLEAERLSVLLQLDKARADLDGYRRSVSESLSAKARAEADQARAAKEEYEEAVHSLSAQQAALVAQRDELQRRVDELQQDHLPAALAKAMADAQLAAPVAGIPLRMSPVPGVSADAEEIIRRITAACTASGVSITRNHAAALLALLAVCPRFSITCTTLAAASTLAQNIAVRLGWGPSFARHFSAEQKPLVSAAPVNGTPAVLLSTLPQYAPLEKLTKVLLFRSGAGLHNNPAYELQSWPVYPLPALPFVPELPAPACQAVSAASLKALADQAQFDPRQIDQVLAPVLQLLPPLSGESARELHRFVGVCSGIMDGGFAAACDWAILLWLLPLADRTARTIAALKPLLQEYPLSLAHIQG